MPLDIIPSYSFIRLFLFDYDPFFLRIVPLPVAINGVILSIHDPPDVRDRVLIRIRLVRITGESFAATK